MILPRVKIMALTATASKASQETIVHSLRMYKPRIVYIPPMKKNIFYATKPKPCMEDFIRQIASSLRELRTNMPRLIILQTV